MSTACPDCEAIVVADDDVPADLVRIAMANHERFCKPGRREICDICDDVDFITSSGETNIQAVLARLTGFRNPTPGALDQHLRRHNRHDLTARLPGLHAAKPIATPSTQREEPTMNLQSVPEGRPAAASLVDHEDKRIAKAAKELLRMQAELEALEARIKEQKAILIDAVEVGGTVEIDGAPMFRVQQRGFLTARREVRQLLDGTDE